MNSPDSGKPLDTVTDVETPEHIRFRYRIAGPAHRGVAYLLDLVIRVGMFAALMTILTLAGAFGEMKQGILLVIAFLLEWGYPILFESLWGGLTPGKRAMHLRVVKEGGYPVGFVDCLLRNLLRAADILPIGYVLGLLVMSGDRRFRRLGDRLAGTMVVVEERTQLAQPLTLNPPLWRTELDVLPSHIRLSPNELDALESFLRRAPSLSPARELELANMLVPHYVKRFAARLENPTRFLAAIHQRATNPALPTQPAVPPAMQGRP
jgi:uncharacterized RDD family membrane protein YckC